MRSSVVVTGAAGAIGRAIVERLRSEHHVIGVDLHPCDADTSMIVAPNASIPDGWHALMSACPPIGGLVVSAGICQTVPAFEETRDQWDATLFANLTVARDWIFRLGPAMREQRGAVVLLSSASAFLPKPDQFAYGVSKAGLVSLTRSMAAAFAPEVRVNAVAPGLIASPMAEANWAKRPPGARERVSIPLGREGTPDEVAKVVHFLLSDAASYVTGQTLGVCGGLLMR